MKKLFYGLYIIIALLSFIPISKIPLIKIAPINLILYLTIILLSFFIHELKECLSSVIVIFLLIFLAYSLYDFGLNYFKSEYTVNIFANFRRVILVILTIFIARREAGFKFAFKVILIMITISTFFSIFIHLFGEPFKSVRDLILFNTEAISLGKGERIAGFAASIFAFSYQITSAVVMAYGIYLAERKLHWIFFFGLLTLGLILNGERSSALMSVSCLIFMLLFNDRKKLIQIAFIVLPVIFTTFLVLNFSQPQGNHLNSNEQTLLNRLGEQIEGEFTGRVLQQLAGVVVTLKNPIYGGTDKAYQKELFILQSWLKRKKHFVVKLSFKEYPAPHNHYVNIGMHAGVTGLAMFILFFILLLKIISQFQENTRTNPNMRFYYLTTVYALFAVLGNAIFHNNGIFFGEITSWFLVGLVCAGSVARVRNQNRKTRNEP